MATSRLKLQDGTSDWPLLGLLVIFLAVFATFIVGLVWMLKPTVMANPGVAAYHPPAVTLLYPVPRKSEERVAVAPSFNSLAAEYEVPQSEAVKPPADHAVAVRRKRVPRDVAEQAYARSWNDGDWNSRYRTRYDGFMGWSGDRPSGNRRQRERRPARNGQPSNGGFWSW